MSADLHLLVARGMELAARIRADSDELKSINERLEAHALANPELHAPLEDAEREGKQVLIHGDGVSVPVIITADNLVKSFKLDTPLHHRIVEAAGGKFTEFFRFVQGYETRQDDGQKFRALAREHLEDKAPAFITTCLARDASGIVKSKIVVAWDRLKIGRKDAA